LFSVSGTLDAKEFSLVAAILRRLAVILRNIYYLYFAINGRSTKGTKSFEKSKIKY
jgi:hypothetical protein